MQVINKKRQNLAREIRSKQRYSKLSQNRQQIFGYYDNDSLVTLIFYMIEKQTDQGASIDQDSFEQFLNLVGDQIRHSQENDIVINNRLISELLDRYGQRLQTFQNLVLKAQPILRIDTLDQTESTKMFDLVRFLFRIQLIKETHLQVLDAFLDSVNLRMKNLCQSDCLDSNRNYFFQELLRLTQLKIILCKQLFYLNQVSKQENQDKDKEKEKTQNNEKQIIRKLVNKWIIGQLLFEYLFDPNVTNQLKKQRSGEGAKINREIQQFLMLYLGFAHREDDMVQKLTDEQISKDFPQKILELVFSMLFILDESYCEKELDISEMKADPKRQELYLLVGISTELVKKINPQSKKVQVSILSEMLEMLARSFVELPEIAVERFFNRMQVKDSTKICKMREVGQYFVSQKLCKSVPLVVRLIRLVEDMQFSVLVSLVELLSILASYSDGHIETMWSMQEFMGNYGKSYNFKSILEGIFIEHISTEVKRRGLWLLSNITASEKFYHYGMEFIVRFFSQKSLEEDYTSTNSSREELLIKESIIQSIMNYVSNLRHFEEVAEMMEVRRQLGIQNESSQDKQHLLGWMMRILGSVVKNISQWHLSGQKQKFLQILIYSLYNLLALQNNRDKEQHQQKAVSMIMEQLQIPKHLELIYHQADSSSQSTYVQMLQTLLDQIDSSKPQE